MDCPPGVPCQTIKSVSPREGLNRSMKGKAGSRNSLRANGHGGTTMTIHIGIDWSHQKHDVVIANECGAVLSRLTIEHGAAGFVKLDKHRADLGVEAAD